MRSPTKGQGNGHRPQVSISEDGQYRISAIQRYAGVGRQELQRWRNPLPSMKCHADASGHKLGALREELSVLRRDCEEIRNIFGILAKAAHGGRRSNVGLRKV